MTEALRIEDLVAGYEAGLPIVRGAALSVSRGEILAVLGPNGAGKSSLVKAAAGLVPITSGRVLLEGRDITRTPAHRMIREGLAFVPQTENVFTNLSVADNLDLAAGLLGLDRRRALPPLYDLFPDLARQRRLPAGRLSGGQRQMLAVARALVASPRVLVLDEPSAGLSPKLVGEVFATVRRVRDTGVAVLLVEQNVKAALALADRGLVLVEGRDRLTGAAPDLRAHPDLAGLYLGAAVRAAA